MTNQVNPNPLFSFFDKNQGLLIHKWLHYFDIYHRHFQKFIGTAPTVLEFGVYHGGSLNMWRDYFGTNARICGVDINPKCKVMEQHGFEIFIGDQQDREFLRHIAKALGEVDVVIEDGGHTMQQQIATFEEIYPIVRNDGVFLMEDLHTSYWWSYGGAYKRKGTFIEYAKNLVDSMNAWHLEKKNRFFKLVSRVIRAPFGGGRLHAEPKEVVTALLASRFLRQKPAINDFTKTTRAMSFYDSVIVFEKGETGRPESRITGKETLY